MGRTGETALNLVKWLSNTSLLDFLQSTTAANFVNAFGHVKLDPERIIMENLKLEHSQMPDDKRILLYTLISILEYSEEIQENDLIYRRLIKELVDVLICDFLSLPDIKAASMNTLTAIIHLKMIEIAQITSFHGLLPMDAC